MKKAIYLFLFLSLVSGVSLLYVSLGFNLESFLVFLSLGLLSILAALTYTMGRKPYGYSGLGDLSVLLFFGFTGVLGSYYLQTGEISSGILLPAVSCGLFSTGVLNINNVRDIESDKKAGKISIPVRIGAKNAKIYHWVLLSTGVLASVIYGFLYFHSPGQWLFLITLPLFVMNGLKLYKAKESEEMDPLLKQLALSTLVFVIIFGSGGFIKF